MQDALRGRAPPEKASDYPARRRLCRRWAKGYSYPGSMAESPEWGLSMPDGAGGVKQNGAELAPREPEGTGGEGAREICWVDRDEEGDCQDLKV